MKIGWRDFKAGLLYYNVVLCLISALIYVPKMFENLHMHYKSGLSISDCSYTVGFIVW